MMRRLRNAFIASVVGGSGLIVPASTMAAPAPTSAAQCSGVTVVVDFHQLGGGVKQVCDAGGAGKSAAQLFTDNGFPLTYVQRTPGFVCRVSGKPASYNCVQTPPSNAYWGLFSADPKATKWSYATRGVSALTVPAGGAVAFSWQGTSGQSLPGVSPPGARRPSKPKPTSQPTSSDTSSPSAANPGASADPSRDTTGKPDASAGSDGPTGESASGAATPGEPTSAAPNSTSSGAVAGAEDTAGSATPDGSQGDPPQRLPAWLVFAGLVALAAGAGGLAWWRRTP